MYITWLAIVVLLSLWLQHSGSFSLGTDPYTETHGICASLATAHGYKCQDFDVETSDGYILSVQRIEGGGGRRWHPVIIQHGLIVDGMAWMINQPEQNLPTILADKGFDVWITNTRGTRFSRRHTSLDPSQREFWDWSWDDLAQYELPAVFDFVYFRTGKKIHYIGHSMGTLTALASLSEGKLADKLISVTLLSPIAYLSHMTSALGVIAAKSPLPEIFTTLKIAEFNPKGGPVQDFILRPICALPEVDCYDTLALISGKNCCLNSSTVDRFLKNEPQSTSTKNMVHLSQNVREGRLAKYNYGKSGDNLKRYGQEVAPAYNLSSIPGDLPMFISHGGRDTLSDPHDVHTLLDILRLNNHRKLTVQFIEDYAHVDFVMAVNAKDVVFSRILSFLTKLQR